ncbi:MAG TPA: two-component regulator propeller domain-containing protein, partial [Saprospiraceae bacterium]|nr:two-component regulator propeller domain-containing protein [Saprospiraceae bacterium]
MLPRNQTFRLFLAAMLLGRAVVFLSSQTPSSLADFNPRFEHFKLPGGEAANAVQCIVQDSVGFIWFGSSAGLLRYDGQSFVTYRHDPTDSNSIASDQVEWIFLDKKGILWLGHWGAGVTAFDPRNGNCIRYNISNGLSDNFVSMIVEDRENFIWIATKEGLNRLNRQTGQFKHFFHIPGDSRSLSYNFVRSLYVDKRDVLWVGCGSPFDDNDPKGNLGGLNRYHPQDGTFTCFLHNPRDPGSLSDNHVRSIFEDSRGDFWVGTGGNGLHLMDRETGRFTRLPFDPAHPSRLSSPVLRKNEARFPPFYHILFITEDRGGRLWIGAAEGGLNVFDPETNKVRHFEQVTGMTDSLQTNSLWHFCQTRDGVVWLSSGGLGGKVFCVKNTNHLFPFFNAAQLGLEHGTFPGAAKDSAGNIWLQVRGDFSGIVRFEPKSGQWKRFACEPVNVARTFLDFEELTIDRQGNIWASTPQGLYKMDPKHPERTNGTFRPDEGIAQRIDYKTLWPPYFDSDGNTWIAAWGDGLYRLNNKMELTHYRHDTADPGSIGGNQVEKVFEDSAGNIVVHGGSINIDPKNPLFFDRFEPDPFGGKDVFKHLLPPGEMGDPCRAVVDKNGNFWFAAFPYGVRKLDNTGAYTSYTVANGALLSDPVTDMVMGRDGHIWMASTGYIIELDPETESFYTYSAHHGVQNLAWTWVTGSCIGPDGEIVFSGEGGFHAFFPEDVHRMWVKKPMMLRITDLKIFGKSVVPGRNSILGRPIWETGEIRLPHDQNVFSFNVACFDFYGPELSRLEFRLENYDRDWRSDLREGEAGYVNVPPGAYVFRVRGANSMGVRGSEIALQVVVLPPWWQTWWAYLLYTTFFFGGIFFLYRFQLNRRLEHAETLRLQELDTVKTKLYTNITHEFRTPLTVILGMARQVLDNPKDYFRHGLDMIIRNGQNLLDLVNQMLDLSKLESGKLSLHLQQSDAVNFLKYLVESFHSLAESKDIKIHFLNDVEVLTMDFDP